MAQKPCKITLILMQKMVAAWQMALPSQAACRFRVSAANYGMAGTGYDSYKLDSLRPRRLEGERVLLALAISILIHALIWGGYELNKEGHWFRNPHWFAPKQRIVIQMPRFEQPLEFVTVQNPSTEAPQNTKFFSSHNALAANPDANKITDQPKLDGKQTDVPATVDIYRPQF